MNAAPAPRVRPRTEADTEQCVRALAAVHHRDGYPVTWPPHPAAWLTAPAAYGAWVAELDARPVAHVALSRPAPDDLAPAAWAAHGGTGPTAVVTRLFVSPDARGHGIGALLLAHATAEAHRLGRHPILDVVTTDTAATALYERLGWRPLTTHQQRWTPTQAVTVRCYAAPLTTERSG